MVLLVQLALLLVLVLRFVLDLVLQLVVGLLLYIMHLGMIPSPGLVLVLAVVWY